MSWTCVHFSMYSHFRNLFWFLLVTLWLAIFMLGNCKILQVISWIVFFAVPQSILCFNKSLKKYYVFNVFFYWIRNIFWIVLNSLEVALSILRNFRKLRIKQVTFVILLNKFHFIDGCIFSSKEPVLEPFTLIIT